MPELGPPLREYVDAVAPPVTFDEVEARPPLRRAPRSRRWLAAAAVLAVVAGVVGLVVSQSDDPEPVQRIETGPDHGLPVPEPAWLTPFGVERPMPEVPYGWKRIDYDAIRFAVPADWDVRAECEAGGAPGAVQVAIPSWATVDEQFCRDIPGTPTVRLERDRAPRDLSAPPTRFGFEVRGPLAGTIRSTRTDSGVRRVLQRGPVADTTGWKEVRHRGVALRIPPSWPLIDLGSRDGWRRQTPGCSWLRPTFARDDRPIAFVDEGGGGECSENPDIGLQLDPGQGVWLRYAGADPLRDRVSTSGRIGGLDVTVGDLDVYHDDPVLELIASDGERWVSVTIGVGDVPVARAILRSLHRAAG